MQSRGDLGAGIALTSPEITLIITLMIMMIAESTIVMPSIIMMPISMMNLRHHLRARGAETDITVMIIRIFNTLVKIGRTTNRSAESNSHATKHRFNKILRS